MNIWFLYWLMLPVGGRGDVFYAHTVSECAFAYTITKRWELRLNGRGTFHLKFSKWDTRRKQASPVEFIGSWVSKNDTITLTVAAPLPNNCFVDHAHYVQLKDTLKFIGIGNACLPERLERNVYGQVHIL
jgi:hypothetical protein